MGKKSNAKKGPHRSSGPAKLLPHARGELTAIVDNVFKRELQRGAGCVHVCVVKYNKMIIHGLVDSVSGYYSTALCLNPDRGSWHANHQTVHLPFQAGQ